MHDCRTATATTSQSVILHAKNGALLLARCSGSVDEGCKGVAKCAPYMVDDVNGNTYSVPTVVCNITRNSSMMHGLTVRGEELLHLCK